MILIYTSFRTTAIIFAMELFVSFDEDVEIALYSRRAAQQTIQLKNLRQVRRPRPVPCGREPGTRISKAPPD